MTRSDDEIRSRGCDTEVMDAGLRVSDSDPLARELTQVIRAGSLESLGDLLRAHPGLA